MSSLSLPSTVTVSFWTFVSLIFCLVCFLPPCHLFSAFCLALLSPLLFSGFCCLFFFPNLPPVPSIFTCLWLPPPAYVLLFLYFSGPLPFFVGRRWNLGDQWREYQGHEACTSYRAHQEWRPARPSGAQEGWRLGAWIWWVNLRKHSLLPHLHALSQGTPSGWWWVEEGRTILPSQDPSPIPGTNPPGRGRGLMVLGVFLVEVAAGLWDFWGSAGVEVLLWVLLPPPAVTCTQFSCHSAVTVHLLATEQKHCAGTLQKGGGSVSVLQWKEKLVWLTRIVKINVFCG